jgi:hypothetical protein
MAVAGELSSEKRLDGDTGELSEFEVLFTI